MTIAKKVEEFKKLANESFARGGFLTTDYPGMAGVNEWELDPIAILAWLETSLREVEEAEHKRCVDLLDNDHTKCLVKESCIGYQNAQSDLINNPPQSLLTKKL